MAKDKKEDKDVAEEGVGAEALADVPADAPVEVPAAEAPADAPAEDPGEVPAAEAPVPEVAPEPAPAPVEPVVELLVPAVEPVAAEAPQVPAEPIGAAAIDVSGPEIEGQIRKDYQEGKLNHQQLADKYRYSLDEIRRILGDHDLDPTFDQMNPPGAAIP